MAYAGSLVSTGIGLRYVRVALRDTDNKIKVPTLQTPGLGYQGQRIGGAEALTITIPDPQKVPAKGDDRIYYTFQLPPTEGVTGELRVTKTNMAVLALLQGALVTGSPPNVKKIGLATDLQGLEKAVVLWGSRQGIDSDEESVYFGQQLWQTYFLLNAQAVVKPAPMEDATVGETTYSITANDAGVDELGVAFTEILNGFTKAAYLMIVTKGRFGLDAFVGDNSEDEFVLSHTPTADSVTLVTKDGTIASSGWALSGNTITFNPAAGTGVKVMVEYEW